jgi:protein phosphatase
MPELTDEQKSELPKNVITRALGMQEHVAVDLQSDEARAGDAYVLCSDGLSGMIDDREILEVIERTPDLETACRRLVALANEHGGEDNITALVVRIEAEPGEERINFSDTLPTVGGAWARERPQSTLDANDTPAPVSAPKPLG